MLDQKSSLPVRAAAPENSSQFSQLLMDAGGQDAQKLIPTVRHLARNATLFYDGDAISFIYEIIEGTIKTSKILMDGRRQIIGFLGVGDIIGLPFEDEAHFSAEAVSASIIRCYPIAQIETAITRSPHLARKLFKILNTDTTRQIDHVMSLGRKHPTERVAGFLLSWRATHTPGQEIKSHILKLPMSRIDIADYLGLTQETVCRVLSKFKTRGIIQSEQSRDIVINDIRSLEHVAEAGILN